MPRLWEESGSETVSSMMSELPVYLLVLGAMGLVAVYSFMHAQRHLQVLTAISLMAGPSVTMMEYHAVTGSWPVSNDQAGFSDAIFQEAGFAYVNSIQIRDGGSFDVLMARGALQGKIVSFRGFEQPEAGLPVVWSCAHAPTPTGMAAAADLTTVPDNELPSPCRRRK